MELVNNIKKRDYFTKYNDQARKVLESLLEKYADEGTGNIENMKMLQVKPVNWFSAPVEITKFFQIQCRRKL